MARPWYFPAVPLDFPGLPAPFLARPCLEPILRSHKGAPSVGDLRCLTVVSRGIREPSGVEGGAQQPHPAVREIPVQLQKPARTYMYYLDHF